MATSRHPFRGQPVSRDDLPMTLYHLTSEGPRGHPLISVGEQAAEAEKTNDPQRVEQKKRIVQGWREGRQTLRAEKHRKD